MAELNKMDNKVIIRGIIDQIRQHEGVFYYDVTLPAPDEYSRPASVVLSTNERLPQKVGEVVNTLCKINSYYRTFQLKNGDTGRDYKTRFEVDHG